MSDVRQNRQIPFAIPNEHGIWALWLSPFLIGWGVAGTSTAATLWTFLAILLGFFARHPLIILVKVRAGRLVKVRAGRRQHADLRPALFWTGSYSLAAAIFAFLIARSGAALLLLLLLPALALLAWHLSLVYRSRERQLPVELVGSGILALAAPAAHISSSGSWTVMALLLWLFTWGYATVSIVYIYLRLDQRRLSGEPDRQGKLTLGRPALRVAAVMLVLVTAGTYLKVLPRFAPLPFLLTQFQVIAGTLRPAVGVRPARIGLVQVGAFLLFTLLTIWVFRA